MSAPFFDRVSVWLMALGMAVLLHGGALWLMAANIPFSATGVLFSDVVSGAPEGAVRVRLAPQAGLFREQHMNNDTDLPRETDAPDGKTTPPDGKEVPERLAAKISVTPYPQTARRQNFPDEASGPDEVSGPDEASGPDEVSGITASSPLPQTAPATAPSGFGESLEGEQAADGRKVYLARVETWLKQHLRYPRTARIRGVEGTAVVRFTLNRRGELVSRRLVRGSGFRLLDREALTMLERADPMPPFPDDLTASVMEIVLPVGFSLNR